MRITFKLRRGPAAEWTTDNPVLSAGEPGLEIDTGLMKVGDGVKAWVTLPYFLDTPATVALINNMLEDATIDGVPGLKGDKGDTGDQGIQGIQGIQGVKGDAGNQGIQGVKGDTGDQGIQGVQGVAGNDGTDYTGPTITTSSTAPSSPSVGDVWIDTSA